MEDLLIDFDFFCHGVWNGQYWAERDVFKKWDKVARKQHRRRAGKKELQAEQRVAERICL